MKKNFVLGFIAGGFLATLYFVVKNDRKKISNAINDGGRKFSDNNNDDFDIFIC